MNKKQLFKTVAEHLLNQQEQSEKGGLCMYRGPYGNTCAVGCLISDEAYTTKLEGLAVGAKLVVKALNTSLNDSLTESDIDLLIDLQNIHDNFYIVLRVHHMSYISKIEKKINIKLLPSFFASFAKKAERYFANKP